MFPIFTIERFLVLALFGPIAFAVGVMVFEEFESKSQPACVTQEALDQMTAESGGYEITVDEYCEL